VRVHRALDRLEADPLELDHARMRFSQSPPPYKSSPSGTTTRSASPDTRSDEQRRRERRRYLLIRERAASLPQKQFKAEVEEERKRIWYADPRTRMHTYRSIDRTFEEDARETIKKRWIEQGIWKNKWDNTADGLWKHEEPPELESELETETEAVSPSRPFSFSTSLKPPPPKPRQAKSDNEKRRIAERRAVREREREASRPYHQFVYQISKERERMQDESANREGADAADINTRAYENVKNAWTMRGIWNGRWGILPGMSWKHERPLEEETADDPAPVPWNPLVNGSHDAGEAPTRRIFGPPSPIASNHHQTSGIMNTSQQGPSADVDSARLENGDAERTPSASNLPRPRTGKRVLRPTTGQALRPSRKPPSRKDGQPQPVASASLGPAHSSKASKATGKKRPGPQRRLNASQEVPSGDPPLLSGPDIAEPLPQTASIPPRRSKRLEPPEPGTAKGPTGIASTDLLKTIAGSRPKRKAAGNPISMVSTKPQGISKRQRSSPTRGKARKG
jgi:hypothetical protein